MADRQTSATHLKQKAAASLQGGQMNTGVTADSFQRKPELLRRTFVWSIRQVTNTLMKPKMLCELND